MAAGFEKVDRRSLTGPYRARWLFVPPLDTPSRHIA
jgi:hypothetical protein